MVKPKILGFFAAFGIVIGGSFVLADEGMWLLNDLPLKQLEDKYNFRPSLGWVARVIESSARLPNCSSSFVSGDGLLMTNWHCAEEAVQALSTPKNNLYEKGFYARTFTEELKTNLNVRVLKSISDVTKTVSEAVTNDTTGNPTKVRQEALARIQKDMVGLATNMREDESKYVCEIVVLYQGGLYDNYCYKIYDDIRLVFALERNVGFFGGDADNFEYPRYTFDVAFLRAYENGKPAKTPFHFKWSKNGARPDELRFVSGHPGNTKRLFTSEALRTERDVRVPFLLDLFRRRELTTKQFMIRGKEQHRIAESDLFSWQNSRKLYVGKIRGLYDPKLMADKEASERNFFIDFYNDAVQSGKYADGLIMVGDAQDAVRKNYAKYMLLVRGLGFDSRLYDYAQSITSGNKAVAQTVLEARAKEPPLNLEFEESKLRDSLAHFIEVFGAEDEVVTGMPLYQWGGPSERAYAFVRNTVLSDINKHRSIVADMGNEDDDGDGIDPMLGLAEYIESKREKYRKLFNDAADQERRGYALLSQALRQGYDSASYPDATFTLRLTFGRISGYTDNGQPMPPFTTIGGAYRHAAEFGNVGDYKLPNRWYQRKQFVNLRTPLNFVSDVDITGGNSGSPVFNKDLEIVGLVFDSNIYGLVSDYDYNYSPQARAIAVHSSGIIEILSKIYRADRLVKELTRK